MNDIEFKVSQEVLDKCRALYDSNNKVAAIKEARAATGMVLKIAKEWCEHGCPVGSGCFIASWGNSPDERVSVYLIPDDKHEALIEELFELTARIATIHDELKNL